jgi:hypothetical protein
MKHCASMVIFSAIYIYIYIFIFYFFYFLFFTLLQLTTDLYASAVRGNIPLKDYGRKVFLDIERTYFLCGIRKNKSSNFKTASRRVLDFALPKPLVFI